MFNNKDLEAGFFVFVLLGSILFAWPVIQTFFPSVPGDRYTELYLLSETYEADNYPSEVHAGEQYTLYVFVVNHRAASSYYKLHMKIVTDDDSPSTMSGIPANSSSIIVYPILIPDNEKWEQSIIFSFPEIQRLNDTILLPSISIGTNDFKLNQMLKVNDSTAGKLGLLFELWLLDESTSEFQYNSRFVQLWLYVVPPT